LRSIEKVEVALLGEKVTGRHQEAYLRLAVMRAEGDQSVLLS
jgi:hypothetical protein